MRLFLDFHYGTGTGVHILENTFLPQEKGGNYQPTSFGEKVWKKEEKKWGNVREKGRKGERGKEKEKIGSKRVNDMQKREAFRQEGHYRSKKNNVLERGKMSFSEKGEGNKYSSCIKI